MSIVFSAERLFAEVACEDSKKDAKPDEKKTHLEEGKCDDFFCENLISDRTGQKKVARVPEYEGSVHHERRLSPWEMPFSNALNK